MVNTVEPIPGVPPSPSHIAKLYNESETTRIDLMIQANYFPEKNSKIIANKIGVNFLSLPAMVGGNEQVDNYITLFDFLIDQITSKLDS